MITGDLRSRVDKLWTTFWNNGISNPLSVIEQISYLLFIKRLDDLELTKERKAQRLGRTIDNPTFGPHQQHIRWSQFKNLDDAKAQLDVVRDEAFPFIKTLGEDEAGDAEGSEKNGKKVSTYVQHMRDAVFLIAQPALLATVIEQIEQIPMEGRDTKGDLYEYMLSKLGDAGTNGQFRTPRHIIKLMVELMAPGPRDVICDPACGTAGFLVAASEYVRELKDADGGSILNAPGNREHYDNEMFHGFDFDTTMLRISSMNLMLHGIEQPIIEARDSLSEDHGGVEERFTMILANPPFKGSVEKSTIAKDLTKVISTTKTELLFMALFLRLLKAGGKAAVIVPDGVLFGSSKAHKGIRKILVEEHKLDGVISMPSGVFKPYAGVSTAILMFTKVGVKAAGTDFVWFYDMVADGLSLDDKRQPVAENDIPDILRRWKDRDPQKDFDRESKTFFVSREEIADNDYNLLLQRYRVNPDLEFLATPPEGFEQKILKETSDIFFSPTSANRVSATRGNKKAVKSQEVVVLSGRDIDNQGEISFISATKREIFDEISSKCFLKKGDILIQRNFSNHLKVALIRERLSTDSTFDTSLLCIRPNPKEINPKHLFIFLKSERGQRLLNLMNSNYSSAIFRHLSISILEDLPVLLPTIKGGKGQDERELEIRLSPTRSAYVIHEITRKILPELTAMAEKDVQDKMVKVSQEMRYLSTLIHTSFEDKVLEQFPTPISLAYRSFVASKFNDYERVRRLLDVFEAASFFLYNIVLADYLQNLQKSGYEVNKSQGRYAYKGFSMASRMSFISAVISMVPEEKGKDLFFPELIKSEVAQTASLLQKDFRNSISHTKTASRSKQKQILDKYYPIVQKMLTEIEFLADYRLARIPYLYFERGFLWRQVEIYQGTQPKLIEEKISLDRDRDTHETDRRHLVLISEDERVLTLHPMYQLVETEETMFEPHICFLKQCKEDGLHGESTQGALEMKLDGFEEFKKLSIPSEATE